MDDVAATVREHQQEREELRTLRLLATEGAKRFLAEQEVVAAWNSSLAERADGERVWRESHTAALRTEVAALERIAAALELLAKR